MQVAKAMVPFENLITCKPTETVQNAIDKMGNNCCNSVVIVQKKNVVGIVTSIDIFEIISSKKDRGLTKKLKDIMSTTLLYVDETDPINATITKMELAQTHHLLVKNPEGVVTGLISSFDIVREKARDIAAHPWIRQ